LTTREGSIVTFDEIVKTRRSVREFEDRPVSNQDILAMVEAARWAPSACNGQTWRFIAVTDKERIKRICKEGMRAVISNKWLREAPLIIVGCSDLDIIANKIGARITGIDYYAIDFGIAMEHIVLKATELGLGTCWVGWFNEEKLKAVLDIPEKVRTMALLAVGYPKDTPAEKRTRKPIGKILFSERWGNEFSEDD
jgi:nitroreductase